MRTKYLRSSFAHTAGFLGLLFLADIPASAQIEVISGGNVGVGTSSPTTHLHVAGSGDQEISLSSSDASGRRWTVQSSGTGTNVGKLQVVDRTANASRLTIDANGSVGIGVTSMQSENKLTLGGISGDEGGQIAMLPGSGYTTSWIFDNYQGGFRLLKGTSTGASSTQIAGIDVNSNLWLPGKAAFGPSMTATDAIVNASNNTGAFTTAFHGSVTSNSGVGGIFDVGNGANTWGADILILRRMMNGGVAPAVGLSATVKFMIDAGSAGSHAPADAGKITSILTATNGTANSTALAFETSTLGSMSEKLRIANNGNVGIGTNSPGTALDIYAPSDNYNGTLKLKSSNSNNAGLTLWTGGSSTMRNWQIANNYATAGGLSFMRSSTNTGDPTTYVMELDASGNVGIGTTAPSQKLEVAGSVRATSFISNSTTYADFVFEPGYRLPSLSEVEAHIKELGHLPGIPSEAEAKEHGIDLAAMQVKLLQKIEELTLHQIAQDKRIQALEVENGRLRDMR